MYQCLQWPVPFAVWAELEAAWSPRWGLENKLSSVLCNLSIHIDSTNSKTVFYNKKYMFLLVHCTLSKCTLPSYTLHISVAEF